MKCELCGAETTPIYNGDFPIIYKCPKCGHLQIEEEGDVPAT